MASSSSVGLRLLDLGFTRSGQWGASGSPFFPRAVSGYYFGEPVVGTGAGTLPALTGAGTAQTGSLVGSGAGTLPALTGYGLGFKGRPAAVYADRPSGDPTSAWTDRPPADSVSAWTDRPAADAADSWTNRNPFL